jgi:hypothetical protein
MCPFDSRPLADCPLLISYRPLSRYWQTESDVSRYGRPHTAKSIERVRSLVAGSRLTHIVDSELAMSGVTTLDEQGSRTITNQRVVAQLTLPHRRERRPELTPLPQ